MKLTNCTKQVRTVCFGVQELKILPLETVVIPTQQEKAAKQAFKSLLWKSLFDNKVFSLEEQASLSEDADTYELKVEAPEYLKQANKKGKGRAKITQKPTLDGSVNA